MSNDKLKGKKWQHNNVVPEKKDYLAKKEFVIEFIKIRFVGKNNSKAFFIKKQQI